ncbi:MAG TPA: SCO family protein [Chloroflexota bacterium]|nr:SCO family protein [Chloroflexota bacterium]
MLRSSRRSLAAAAGSALALAAGLSACVPPAGRKVPPLNGGVLDQPLVVPPLSLRRADGQPFNTGEARGRWWLAFFGYTSCPDVCPLTLAYMTQVRRLLGARAPAAYFITVDPERDTPERLAAYMSNFDPGIVALTGTEAELALAREAFGVVAQRRPVAGAAGYSVDHTALVFLVDPEARVRVVYPHGMVPADIAADLKRLM